MLSPSSSSSDDNSTIKASDERTPLLSQITPIPTSEPIETSLQAAEAEGVRDTDKDVPLPRRQIFLLCYTRLVEPIAFFSIFPYINSMIEKTGGIDKEDVGFYSGLIESLFSVTQMCVMIFWGKAADRFGRKPCLVISLFGITGATALFGMSTSLWQMILFRCIGGIFAGTLVTVRAMITENSTKKTQAKAFSYFAFAGNVGIFLGPLLGGLLESPAKKFPSIVGRVGFFNDYPYALPGFVTASVGLSAAISTALFVRETLHIHHSNKSTNEEPMSAIELMNYPGISRVIIIYEYVLLLGFAYTAVNPVFLYTPVNLGGIGFQPELIAAAIGLNGIAQALWLLLIFPPLHNRIGTGGVLRLCALGWPVFLAAGPICNVLLRYNFKAAFWTVGPINIVAGSGVAMGYTAIQLAVNDIAPTHETLGTLNSIVLAVSSGLRAVVPALSTSVYATGVKYHIAGGQLFWIIAIAIACGMTAVLRLLPAKVEGKIQEDEGEEAIR